MRYFGDGNLIKCIALCKDYLEESKLKEVLPHLESLGDKNSSRASGNEMMG